MKKYLGLGSMSEQEIIRVTDEPFIFDRQHLKKIHSLKNNLVRPFQKKRFSKKLSYS